MKKLALLLLTASVLSGCMVYEQRPYRDGAAYRGDRDRDGIPNRVDRDRDGDGVPNRLDRRPNDPRWY